MGLTLKEINELKQKFISLRKAFISEEYMEHSGTPQPYEGSPTGSGRYRKGSGDNPYQHGNMDFLDRIDKMKRENFTFTDEDGVTYKGETAIYKHLGMSSTEYRDMKSLARDERRSNEFRSIKRMHEKEGKGWTEIGRELGMSESSVRSRYESYEKQQKNTAQITADALKSVIDKKGIIDIGPGAELELGVSKERLSKARKLLEQEGYVYYVGGIPNVTNPGKQINTAVLMPPGSQKRDFYEWRKGVSNIESLRDYDILSKDGGDSFQPKFVYPASMDPKRLKIRYADEVGPDGHTGVERDGVMQIRRGVKDLDLGEDHYSQVRIMVGGTHYLKGMAVYSDDLPDGVDIVFNTNKPKGTPMMSNDKNNSVLKLVKTTTDENGNKIIDKDNPFGSLIKEGVYDPTKPNSDKQGGQSYFINDKGEKQLSLINKRAAEGDWSEWKNKVPSQFLGKQDKSLIKKQLDLAVADKQAEFDEIMSLTNPTVKKMMLQDFADGCDKAAVTLHAAPFPRQKYQVILPIASLRDNEVYAPQFRHGEEVALIRYPHGGTFEIPKLIVNNRNPEGVNTLGDVRDAVGINMKNAERLSGADFDGDTVMVIPVNEKVRIKNSRPLEGLEGFDPKLKYKIPDGDTTTKRMVDTQKQMGMISNLITDMTLKGADEEDLAAAVRHSMVVIDAEKHGLDYKRSEADNRINALKERWQAHYDPVTGELVKVGGVSTLLSMAKSPTYIPKRQGEPRVNLKINEHKNDLEKGDIWYDPTKPEGALLYKIADDAYYTDANGKQRTRTQKSNLMSDHDDAYELSTGLVKENLYADYANKMKAMANEARKEKAYTKEIPLDPLAKEKYPEEIKSLEAKLRIAEMNAPRERQAQYRANIVVERNKARYKAMGLTQREINAQLKKDGQKALSSARNELGAKKDRIKISDKEWDAIQSGAIPKTKLNDILQNCDKDTLKERAMPKNAKNNLSPAKIAKIKQMKKSGYTGAEIADALNISRSTVYEY